MANPAKSSCRRRKRLFYVIDRTNGKLISAKAYTTVTWAKGIDMKTGRPIENPDARYAKGPTLLKPGPIGGHNWQPMSYDPQTGLVYIPVMDGAFVYTPQTPLHYKPGAWNTGNDFAEMGDVVLKAIKAGNPPPPTKGYIRAWNPVTQKMAAGADDRRVEQRHVDDGWRLAVCRWVGRDICRL